MKPINLFLSVVLLATMISCGGKTKQSSDQEETGMEQVITAETSHVGAYTGTLPCADCPGIETDLTLNEDGTYTLLSEYLEKEPNNVFEESGVYSVLDNDLIELTAPSTGDKIYYKLVEKGVAVSDAYGNINEGELAENYILIKK